LRVRELPQNVVGVRVLRIGLERALEIRDGLIVAAVEVGRDAGARQRARVVGMVGELGSESGGRLLTVPALNRFPSRSPGILRRRLSRNREQADEYGGEHGALPSKRDARRNRPIRFRSVPSAVTNPSGSHQLSWWWYRGWSHRLEGLSHVCPH